MLAVVQTKGAGARLSPYSYPPALEGAYGAAPEWGEVLQHMAQRLQWMDASVDGRLTMVFSVFLFFERWLTLSASTLEIHHPLQAVEALHVPLRLREGWCFPSVLGGRPSPPSLINLKRVDHDPGLLATPHSGVGN